MTSHLAQWTPGAVGPLLMREERAAAGWRGRAACRDADANLFFSAAPDDVTAAKAICAGCPVRQSCLEFALGHGERHGTWGGLGGAGLRAAARSRVAPPRPPKPPSRPLAVLMDELTPREIARFRSRTAAGGCGLTWTGAPGRGGWGFITITRDGVLRNYRAHRVAYKLATGTDPGADTVIQACGDRLCLTPGCLQIETAREMRLRAARPRIRRLVA